MSFSAPGSVIVAGEYAMFFGKPAIATAIDLYATSRLISRHSKKSVDTILSSVEDETKQYLKKHNLLGNSTSYAFEVTSDIPHDDTFGYTDAIIMALVALILNNSSKKDFSNEEIHTIAYHIEKKIHKKELGIHCIASSFGGLVYYRKEFEFLKNISALNMRIPKGVEQFLFFVDTGKAVESDEELENFVGKSYNADTKKIETIFQQIEKTVKRMVVSIAKEDRIFFKESIKQSERSLEDLGVVSGFTKRVVRDIEEFGTAKIIGNGGRKNRSGYLLVYAEKEAELKKIINRYKLSYFPLRQSAKGLAAQMV